MTHKCCCILTICVYFMITRVESVEKVLTYEVNTKTDSIWEYDNEAAEGCEKIKYKRGFQLFCVDDVRFSCTLKSKPLFLDDFKSEFFNITIENSLGNSKPCDGCSGDIIGTVDVLQSYKDSDGQRASVRSHNFALAESVTTTIQKKPNLEYIEVWFTYSTQC